MNGPAWHAKRKWYRYKVVPQGEVEPGASAGGGAPGGCGGLCSLRMLVSVLLLGLLVGGILAAYLLTPRTQRPDPPHRAEVGKVHGSRIRYPHTRRQLPHAIIIGVRKGGTRALLNFLNLHRDVVVSGAEVHFFDDDDNYSMGLDWYRRQMPFSFSNQITIEKTPAYFVNPHAPSRIHAMNSSIKLLLILRNPVDRTVSDYLQIMTKKMSKGKVTRDFESLVLTEDGEVNAHYLAIKSSLYIRHLQRWLRFFPISQIHVVDSEKFVEQPWAELRDVETFLGLQHQIFKSNFTYNRARGFYCMQLEEQEKCLSPSKGRKHPDLDPWLVEKLKTFFRPYNEKLFNVLGRRFDWD